MTEKRNFEEAKQIYDKLIKEADVSEKKRLAQLYNYRGLNYYLMVEFPDAIEGQIPFCKKEIHTQITLNWNFLKTTQRPFN